MLENCSFLLSSCLSSIIIMEPDTVTSPASRWSQLFKKLHQRLNTSLRSSILAGRPLLVKRTQSELIFSCLRNGRVQKLPIKLPFSSHHCRLCCFGNLDGWLAINTTCSSDFLKRDSCNSYLINPISGEQIFLPRLDDKDCMSKAAVSSSPTSDNCTIIVHGKFHGIESFASCKLGRDNQWNLFEAPLGVSSMAFHKGKLYVHSEISNRIRVYDFDPDVKLVGYVDGVLASCSNEWKLVDSEDELLLVGKSYVYDKATARDRVKFCVLKMEEERWVRIESLGDRLLVLSEYGANCLRVDEVVGSDFRGNCIYEVPMYGDMLVYSMEDEGCRKVNVSKDDGGVGYGWLMPCRW